MTHVQANMLTTNCLTWRRPAAVRIQLMPVIADLSEWKLLEGKHGRSLDNHRWNNLQAKCMNILPAKRSLKVTKRFYFFSQSSVLYDTCIKFISKSRDLFTMYLPKTENKTLEVQTHAGNCNNKQLNSRQIVFIVNYSVQQNSCRREGYKFVPNNFPHTLSTRT